jgi:predicted dinucleotide-binding enzyme
VGVKIGIIGSGNVGKALASAWKKAGHSVTFAMRDPAGGKATTLKQEGYGVVSAKEAAQVGDILLLAIPWTEIAAVLEGLGPLSGKIVIDATNPLTPDLELAVGFEESGGEAVGLLAQGARVVKAFNITGAENMAKAKDFSVRPVMFVAGDDAGAKKTVQTLAEDIGFEAVDAGPLKASRYLEPMAMQWIKMAYSGRGTQFAHALVSR